MYSIARVGPGDQLLYPGNYWGEASAGGHRIGCIDRTGGLVFHSVEIVKAEGRLYEIITDSGIAVVGEGCRISTIDGLRRVDNVARELLRNGSLLLEQYIGPDRARIDNIRGEGVVDSFFAPQVPTEITVDLVDAKLSRIERTTSNTIVVERPLFGRLNSIVAHVREKVDGAVRASVDNRTFASEVEIEACSKRRSLVEVNSVALRTGNSYEVRAPEPEGGIIVGGLIVSGA